MTDFRRSTLFMIWKKYLELDIFDVDLTLMEGHNMRDPVKGPEQLEGQNTEEAPLEKAIADQLREEGV